MDSRHPTNERKSINLLVKLAEAGSGTFVEKFATNLSSGGMFIWSRDQRADGTVFQVRVEIAGGARLLQGEAVVRWSRAPKDPSGPPGWGLEFTNLDPASAALIDRMLGPAPAPAAGAPPPAADFAAQLGSELAEELSSEPAQEFTDDFAAVPAEEPAAEFTDDFAPVPAEEPAAEFTDDFAPVPAVEPDLTHPVVAAKGVAVPAPEATSSTVLVAPHVAAATSVGWPGGIIELSGEEAAQEAAEPTGRFDVEASSTVELSGEEAAQFAAEPTSRFDLASLSSTVDPTEPNPRADLPSLTSSTIELSKEEVAQLAAEPTGNFDVEPSSTIELSGEEAIQLSAEPTGKFDVEPSSTIEVSGEEAAQFVAEPTRKVELASLPSTIELSGEEAAQFAAEPTRKVALASLTPSTVEVSPELLAPLPVQRTLAANLVAGLPADAVQRTLATNPALPTQRTLAANPAADLRALRPPVAAPPPAAPKRPPPMEAVNIDLKRLVNTTPAPPNQTETNIFVAPSLFLTAVSGPPAALLPRRRERSIPLPRGTLKPAPIRRSRAVDQLAYLSPPPAFVQNSPVVGIDLGTTNSCCAVLSGGKPVVLKTKDGLNVIPSLVAINKLSKMVVGQFAHAEMLLNPAQCIYGSKRLVGRDFESPAVNAVRERFHYEIIEDPDGKAAVKLGGKRVSLEEVQAIVLNECRLLAEAFLATRVSRAVITCPAYFTEPQRQSIRTAGALAGLRVERILNEPTAAALAYGLNQDLSRKVLVYDVGGGTFDATLLRIEKNVFEVLATGGDVFLGGLDFDNQLINSLLRKFEAQHKVTFSADPGALARVADQAEKAKIALSEKLTIDVHLPMLQLGPKGKPLGLDCTLTRKELEDSCAPLVERTIKLVGELLKDGGMTTADVDEVVLVGGMSRMPMVRERLKALFKKPPHASVNAEEAVAVGAALYSGVVDKVSNVVLIDVAPMTLGFGLPGGGYKRLIARNTPLPASASIGFATTEDMAEAIEISLFQGEDADVSVNDYVGTVRVDGLPRGPKGLVKVAINLKLDADCVLHVEAREMHTRRLYASTLATRYTTQEVRQRLGIEPQKAQQAVNRRTEELKQRGGKFWGFLRQIVARRK